MRKHFLSAILCLFGLCGLSQQAFEGTIIYGLRSSDDNATSREELTVLFGKDGIRLKFRKDNTENKYDNEEILIRLDSGKIFFFNMDDKTYHAKKLQEFKEASKADNLSIAGYSTRAIDISAATQRGLMQGLLQGGSTLAYVADSLYYPVPARFRKNQELIFLYDDHIVIGARITRQKNLWLEDYQDDQTKEDYDTIQVSATAISKSVPDPGLFSIPADYKKFTKENFFPDSAIMLNPDDTTAMPLQPADPVKPAPVPKPVPKPKAKTGAKPAAKKPGK